MLTEMRHGSAANLLFIALEGAPEPELARISVAMQKSLASDARFSRVAGGDAALSQGEEARLFAHRYLLSPIIEAGLFETRRCAAPCRTCCATCVPPPPRWPPAMACRTR